MVTFLSPKVRCNSFTLKKWQLNMEVVVPTVTCQQENLKLRNVSGGKGNFLELRDNLRHKELSSSLLCTNRLKTR